MKRYSIIVITSWIVCFTFPFSLFASTQSNAHQFRTLVHQCVQEIKHSVQSTTFAVNVLGGIDEKEFIRMHCIESLDSTYTINNTSDSILILRIDQLTVEYKETQHSDSLIRLCTFELGGMFTTAHYNNSIPFTKQYIIDTVSVQDIPFIEQPGYSFCKGKKPEHTSSFFQDILQPIVFIGTAAFSVWLLFSVRSQ